MYHLQCVSLTKVPKSTWSCPWHTCWDCDRSSSNSGGMQFRCLECPYARCFDCWPGDEDMKKIEPSAAFVHNLERRGFNHSRNIIYFRCKVCVEANAEKQAKASLSAVPVVQPPVTLSAKAAIIACKPITGKLAKPAVKVMSNSSTAVAQIKGLFSAPIRPKCSPSCSLAVLSKSVPLTQATVTARAAAPTTNSSSSFSPAGKRKVTSPAGSAKY